MARRRRKETPGEMTKELMDGIADVAGMRLSLIMKHIVDVESRHVK